MVAAAREAGYSGALAWSARAFDEYSDFSALEDALGVRLPAGASRAEPSPEG